MEQARCRHKSEHISTFPDCLAKSIGATRTPRAISDHLLPTESPGVNQVSTKSKKNRHTSATITEGVRCPDSSLIQLSRQEAATGSAALCSHAVTSANRPLNIRIHTTAQCHSTPDFTTRAGLPAMRDPGSTTDLVTTEPPAMMQS